MKRILPMVVLALAALGSLAACTGRGGAEPLPNPDVSATPVTKAELAQVIWGVATDPSPAAACLAGSHFQIQRDDAFSIMRLPEPSVPFSRRVGIVSAITIAFADPESDGRGTECAPEALFSYSIAASEEAPIDLEMSEGLAARQSPYNIAVSSNATYPKCLITAYFDRGEPPAKCTVVEKPCGAEAEACCGTAPNQTCEAGLACEGSLCVKPTDCGMEGEACCGTAPHESCDAGLTCSSGTCEPLPSVCGGKGQPCCGATPNQTCNGGLTCNDGTCGIRVIHLPRHPLHDIGDLHVLAQQAGTSESAGADAEDAAASEAEAAGDAKALSISAAVVPGAEGSVPACTEEERYPIKLVVDGVDCRIQLKPGQQAPWDNRERESNRPASGSYSLPQRGE